MPDRIIALAFAVSYFLFLAFFSSPVAGWIAFSVLRLEPVGAVSAGLAVILVALLLLMFTRFLVACVFLSVAGLALDFAGLGTIPSSVSHVFSLTVACALGSGIVILANVKAHSPSWLRLTGASRS